MKRPNRRKTLGTRNTIFDYKTQLFVAHPQREISFELNQNYFKQNIHIKLIDALEPYSNINRPTFSQSFPSVLIQIQIDMSTPIILNSGYPNAKFNLIRSKTAIKNHHEQQQ